jgi:hypothetical protein
MHWTRFLPATSLFKWLQFVSNRKTIAKSYFLCPSVAVVYLNTRFVTCFSEPDYNCLRCGTRVAVTHTSAASVDGDRTRRCRDTGTGVLADFTSVPRRIPILTRLQLHQSEAGTKSGRLPERCASRRLISAHYLWRLTDVLRFILGLCIASVNVFVTMYVSEIFEDSIRGALGNFRGIAADTGTISVYAVGSYLSIQHAGFVCVSVPILFLFAFVWLPESPMFLLGKGKRREAFEAYLCLRGDSSLAEEEMKKLEAVVRADTTDTNIFYYIRFRQFVRFAVFMFLIRPCGQKIQSYLHPDRPRCLSSRTGYIPVLRSIWFRCFCGGSNSYRVRLALWLLCYCRPSWLVVRGNGLKPEV